MRKNTRRKTTIGLLAALLTAVSVGSLLPGKTAYAAAYDVAVNYAVGDFMALEAVVNGELELPEPEIILTPVEYDAAADTMTFEISTNREDVGIAYYTGYGSDSVWNNWGFNDAKIAYDAVVSIKIHRWDVYRLNIWLIDKDGNRLYNNTSLPDYYTDFDYCVVKNYLLEDHKNKINVINSDVSYDPNMYMENGILYFDFESDPYWEEDTDEVGIEFYIYYKADDGFKYFGSWWCSVREHNLDVSYNIFESGTGTYEIATVIDGRVYRAYYNYVKPDISVGEVSDITWSPEQPGVFTFKPCKNADYYLWYVEWQSGEEYYGAHNYDFNFGYVHDDGDITIRDGIGILNLSYVYNDILSYYNDIKDVTSFVQIRAMSNDIERMVHGKWVYSEFTTNPSQNPSESNPESKPSTEPTTPTTSAEPKPSTEPTTPAEPDTKPENPTVSPDDEEDDDDDSRTVTVTDSSDDSTMAGTDSTIINKDNPSVSTGNIAEVTKVEASPTADAAHIFLYTVLAGLSFGIFAAYMSKEKQMN